MLCVANMRKPDAQKQTNKHGKIWFESNVCDSRSEHDKIMIKNIKITKCASLFDCNIVRNIITGYFTVN